MRLYFILLVFLPFSEILVSQNFEQVDAIVSAYPSNFEKTEALSAKISEDFNNPHDRVRAVYNWITQNVAYDWDELNRPSYSYSSEEERVRKQALYQVRVAKRVLQKKKAICSGYAHLFKELCDQLGISCKIVSGGSKNSRLKINKPWRVSHAWNLVTIDEKSYLIDATWGAGHMTPNNEYVQDPNYIYFFTPPTDFIKNHYPENYQDALLNKKVSKKAFSKAPYYHNILEPDYELISPKKLGVLRASTQVTFTFKTNKEISRIKFYMARKWFNASNIVQKDGEVSFTIDLKGKKGRDLDIYINDEKVITYLVRN